MSGVVERRGPVQEVREKVAELNGRFATFEKYEHERWHKLNNDLTPILQLPERLAREMGRLEGLQSGALAAMGKQFELTLKEAIATALEPVGKELGSLRKDVDALKMGAGKNTAIKQLGVWFVQTLISVAAALSAVLSIRHG